LPFPWRAVIQEAEGREPAEVMGMCTGWADRIAGRMGKGIGVANPAPIWQVGGELEVVIAWSTRCGARSPSQLKKD